MIKNLWVDHENGSIHFDSRDNIHDIITSYEKEGFFISVKFKNGRTEENFIPYRKINSIMIEK